jgi:hypothetical protein
MNKKFLSLLMLVFCSNILTMIPNPKEIIIDYGKGLVKYGKDLLKGPKPSSQSAYENGVSIEQIKEYLIEYYGQKEGESLYNDFLKENNLLEDRKEQIELQEIQNIKKTEEESTSEEDFEKTIDEGGEIETMFNKIISHKYVAPIVSLFAAKYVKPAIAGTVAVTAMAYLYQEEIVEAYESVKNRLVRMCSCASKDKRYMQQVVTQLQLQKK